MNLLAIETSTEAGSIAVCGKGELVRRVCPAGVPHSETLLPLIRTGRTTFRGVWTTAPLAAPVTLRVVARDRALNQATLDLVVH